MPELHRENLGPYLESVLGAPVRIVSVAPIGQQAGPALKGFGYGQPILVEFEIGRERRRAVLETMAAGPFGHDHMADRASILLWNHAAYNRLPRHVRSLDVGGFAREGGLVSLGRVDELFGLMEFVEGRGYFEDLEKLRDGAPLGDLDVARADTLCDYLSTIHAVKGPDPALYVRRIRELVGHGECIMGIVDSYPPGPFDAALRAIEQRGVAWRWRLRGASHRLRQVHGDFHPWNLLFRDGVEFTALDRSRGEWGEPADDVTALTMNYVFFALQRHGRVDGHLKTLFLRFWDRYLQKTGDKEILEVAAPFFAFRGLVMASPVWYPHLSDDVRRKLFTFMHRVLDADAFVPERVNDYLQD